MASVDSIPVPRPRTLRSYGINTALRWISPIVVSVALIFEPVIGGAIGWAITGDAYIGTWTLIGGPLMLVGAIMVTLEESRNTQNTDTHS